MQAIKTHKSTFARDGADYVSNVFFRKEAQVQGVNTVKVWDCSLQCYDQRLISTGGSAVEGQYTWLSFLPVRGQGPQRRARRLPPVRQEARRVRRAGVGRGRDLRAGGQRRSSPKSGPNGITRRRCSTAIRGLHDFDANGFIAPTDIGGKVGSKCLIGMQVQNGKFVRVDPVEPGKFDCTGSVSSRSPSTR